MRKVEAMQKGVNACCSLICHANNLSSPQMVQNRLKALGFTTAKILGIFNWLKGLREDPRMERTRAIEFWRVIQKLTPEDVARMSFKLNLKWLNSLPERDRGYIRKMFQEKGMLPSERFLQILRYEVAPAVPTAPIQERYYWQD